MAGWKLRLEERAEGELRSAFLWYDERSPHAADRFRLAVEACINGIQDTPESFPEVEPGIRRRLVRHGFPYGVLYRIVGDEVHVMAVMHLRRRPGYWRG